MPFLRPTYSVVYCKVGIFIDIDFCQDHFAIFTGYQRFQTWRKQLARSTPAVNRKLEWTDPAINYSKKPDMSIITGSYNENYNNWAGTATLSQPEPLLDYTLDNPSYLGKWCSVVSSASYIRKVAGSNPSLATTKRTLGKSFTSSYLYSMMWRPAWLPCD